MIDVAIPVSISLKFHYYQRYSNIAATVGISSIKEEHTSEVKQRFPEAAVALESSKCKEHGHIGELCPSPSDLSCVSCDMLSNYSPLNYDSAVDGKGHL